MIQIKRVYDKSESADGYRILVDRIWPRGVSKEKAKVDLWLRNIAPTDKLRKWFGHKVERWPEFEKKYKSELKKNSALADLKKIVKAKKKVTLLYGAKDTEHNQAVVLRDILRKG
jgi:uncharacterized protein YeaO (DUF488 family)